MEHEFDRSSFASKTPFTATFIFSDLTIKHFKMDDGFIPQAVIVIFASAVILLLDLFKHCKIPSLLF